MLGRTIIGVFLFYLLFAFPFSISVSYAGAAFNAVMNKKEIKKFGTDKQKFIHESEINYQNQQIYKEEKKAIKEYEIEKKNKTPSNADH